VPLQDLKFFAAISEEIALGAREIAARFVESKIDASPSQLMRDALIKKNFKLARKPQCRNLRMHEPSQ
jgi:hypothetical protein